MKIKDCFLRLPVLKSLAFILLASISCNTANEKPEISIVTYDKPGVAVLHGLTKLTNTLHVKNITFEKVGSIGGKRENGDHNRPIIRER